MCFPVQFFSPAGSKKFSAIPDFFATISLNVSSTEDKLQIMNDANTTLNEMNTCFKYGESLFKGLTITATVVTAA